MLVGSVKGTDLRFRFFLPPLEVSSEKLPGPAGEGPEVSEGEAAEERSIDGPALGNAGSGLCCFSAAVVRIA